MPSVPLKDRVAALEAEVAQLRACLHNRNHSSDDWLPKISGTFANDPDFVEAMKLGREWRESFRPKPPRRRRKKKT